jgi:drug/metabolite transporter (DMT)-like permease
MILSLILAAVAGFLFCLSSIYMRKGMYWSGETFTAVSLACFTGTIFFGIATLGTGKINQLTTLSWQSLLLLSLAGIVHFVVGRLMAWMGARLIGANLSNPILNCQGLVSIFLGIVILDEQFTLSLGLAFVLMIAGIILISRFAQGEIGGKKLTRATLGKGIFISIIGSIFFGISPMLIKLGLQSGVSATTGGFISYSAATVILCILLFQSGNRGKMRNLNWKTTGLLCLASVILASAHLLNYMALGGGSVSLVTPMMSSIASLVVFPLSFVINRKIEIFNLPVIVGAVLTTAGVYLIFLLA